MKFSRQFTNSGKNVFELFEYEIKETLLKSDVKEDLPRHIKVEVPKGWSQLSTDILAQKYFRRDGVNDTNEDYRGETSIKQVVDRLAGCWVEWGRKNKYFTTSDDAQIFYDEVCYMLLNQTASPNSPQWFNTGLAYKYNIKGREQGHWYVDPEDNKLKKGKDAFTRPQPHACFIQSVQDDLTGENGIYSLLSKEGRIFKFGSGSGTNFSSIRGKGESLSGGGYSSGLISFLKIYDRAAAAIKSGGTTRRAAKMVCLDIDHPEIEEFVEWKSNEEKKVGALYIGAKIMKKNLDKLLKLLINNSKQEIDRKLLLNQINVCLDLDIPEILIERTFHLANQGVTNYPWEEISLDYEGNGYETVSGQNSNNSIRVSNEFMEKVQYNGKWNLLKRTDGSISKTLNAKDLWNKVCKSAWECADPGIQFDTTINEWHTCPAEGDINGSNPCSEYMFLDDTACNLASLNLDKFFDSQGNLQIELYNHAIRIWTVVLEISVTMAQFPSATIAQKSYDYRTLGLGFANLGCVLMKLGHAYDSPEAEGITGCLSAIMTGKSYAASAEMAKELGAFEKYALNKESMLRVIRNHRRAAYNVSTTEYEGLQISPQGLKPAYCPKSWMVEAKKAWDEALNLGEQYGYRNAQVSVVAPTGTIGLLMDCDTTGIEPDFAVIKYKKLSGGGMVKIVNQSLKPALDKLGYNDQQIESIINYCLGHYEIENSPEINNKKLLEKGFHEGTLKKISDKLKSAYHINDVFTLDDLSERERESLKIVPLEKANSYFDLLGHLGFTAEEIDKANRYVCGVGTIEGAPYLKLEHYSIFDCANSCAPYGKRFIHPKGHLRIMAAAQSFISGAISKTINMPGTSSIQDISDIYKQAWDSGIKAVAIYRDSSKLSQPLSSSGKLSDILQEAKELAMVPVEIPVEPTLEPPSLIKSEWPVKNKRKLPARREGFVQEASIGGHKVFLRTGEYPDGKLGEIFIDMYKEGASYRGLINCFAVLTSKALQYGVPLEVLVESFTFTRFEPSGMVTGHNEIKNSTSILDFIFRALGYHYLGKKELVHVKSTEQSTQPTSLTGPEKKPEKVSVNVNQISKMTVYANVEKVSLKNPAQAGYTGDTCTLCGSMRVRRNGTCTLCDDCGSTSGCS